MTVGPVFVVLIIHRQLLDCRNRSKLKNTEWYVLIIGILCPAYLFMAIPYIDYIDAILNEALIFDVIKSKAPEFVGHSKCGWQFQCFKI